MQRLFVASLVVLLIGLAACRSSAGPLGTNAGVQGGSSEPRPEASLPLHGSSAKGDGTPTDPATPKTIRDFFMLLPERYFVLEGCDKTNDKDCRKAKIDYLRTFTQVEDTANGYLKGGCDGGQSCIEMTIFKKPDGLYLVAVSTESEMVIEQHFLDYADGRWTDAATRVIPEYSKKNIYELPRQGTTMRVFAKKVIEKGDDYEIAEKGTKLYDLVWKEGKFTIRK